MALIFAIWRKSTAFPLWFYLRTTNKNREKPNDCRVKSIRELKTIEVTREEIVVGLDIGTTKVGTVIAAGDAEGSLRIIGVGSTPSRGIKRGVVVDVEETVAAISHSVERAAHMAGVAVEGVIVGVTGEHIESSNCHAAVTVAGGQSAVAGGQSAISRDDVRRVLQAAALEVPRDREIIHSLPRSFTVDGHAGVLRPIGMNGQKLEVETHIVTGKAPFLQNAVQCVERAGFRVEALVLEPIATAAAVTTADEREMGVILIDIGGGTSDLAVFHDGSIVYSGVLPVGGNHVTRDIAIGLRTPFEVAENLKIDSGAATRDMIPHGEALEVTMAGSGERLRIPRAILGEIIEARMSELFELAREMMHQSGARKRLPGGVILSGGGALLPGAIELANAVFAMPVRLGTPQNVTGWSEQVSMPQLATGVGLCRFALTQRQSPNNQVAIPPIAALESRRIWGAIAPAPATQTPVFRADKTARPASKSSFIEVAPNIMETTPTAANAPARTKNITADSTIAPDVAASTAATNAGKPMTDAPFAEATVNATDPSEVKAPRSEAHTVATASDNARAEPVRAADASESARTIFRPSSERASDISRASDASQLSSSATENSARSNQSSDERKTNNVFRRSDLTGARAENTSDSSAGQSWWHKLKQFLGFEKIDD